MRETTGRFGRSGRRGLVAVDVAVPAVRPVRAAELELPVDREGVQVHVHGAVLVLEGGPDADPDGLRSGTATKRRAASSASVRGRGGSASSRARSFLLKGFVMRGG